MFLLEGLIKKDENAKKYIREYISYRILPKLYLLSTIGTKFKKNRMWNLKKPTKKNTWKKMQFVGIKCQIYQ